MSKQISHTEKFEYVGIWWLPEKPKEKLSGMLKYEPQEGLKLNLVGELDFTKKENKKFINSDTDIILGITADGQNITLYKCIQTNKYNLSALSQKFYIQIAFIGHHFKKNEDIVFDNIAINYSYLEQWIKPTFFIEEKLQNNKYKYT